MHFWFIPTPVVRHELIRRAFAIALDPTGGGGGSSGDGGTGDGNGGGGGARTFTEAELAAELDKRSKGIRSTAEREAQKAAEQKLATELGLPVEDVKKILADRKADEDARLSEVEKRERAAAEAETRAKAREEAATKTEREAKIALALAGATVKGERLDYALFGVAKKLGDQEPTEENLKTAVESLKAEAPEFFADGETAPPPGGEQRPPAPIPGRGGNGNGNGAPGAFERGAERAKAAAAAAGSTPDANNLFPGLRPVGVS